MNWYSLNGYEKLINFLFFQIHREKSLKDMDEKNLLRAINTAMNNTFLVNQFYPLLITKTNLFDESEV